VAPPRQPPHKLLLPPASAQNDGAVRDSVAPHRSGPVTPAADSVRRREGFGGTRPNPEWIAMTDSSLPGRSPDL
jgi:hypothetical protein